MGSKIVQYIFVVLIQSLDYLSFEVSCYFLSYLGDVQITIRMLQNEDFIDWLIFGV